MTVSKLKSKLHEDLDKLPLPVLQEIEALLALRLETQKESIYEFRKFGALAGMVQFMAPDFNAPLDDFMEYQ